MIKRCHIWRTFVKKLQAYFYTFRFIFLYMLFQLFYYFLRVLVRNESACDFCMCFRRNYRLDAIPLEPTIDSINIKSWADPSTFKVTISFFTIKGWYAKRLSLLLLIEV